jgi:TPR repeat protein
MLALVKEDEEVVVEGKDDDDDEEEDEEEDDDDEEKEEPESLEAPLTLLAVVKSHFYTLVSLQLCNPQRVALFPFVRLPPRVSHPFARAPLHDMSLTHAERLRALGCGLKGELVRRLSLVVGRHFEPQMNWPASHKMMHSIARCVSSRSLAAGRDGAAKEAEVLCASGQCAAAVVALQLAIYLGDMPSRALMAHMLLEGRDGVAKDEMRAFTLVKKGARLGCHHCQGMLSVFYWGRGPQGALVCHRDGPHAEHLARESSDKGSKYGQYALGRLYWYGWWNGMASVKQDGAQAVALYRLAAAQNLDKAQWSLGVVYESGSGGVARDCVAALQLHRLAAAQGHSAALFSVAECYQYGRGVRRNKAEAIRWFWRANAAGNTAAKFALRKLLA